MPYITTWAGPRGQGRGWSERASGCPTGASGPTWTLRIPAMAVQVWRPKLGEAQLGWQQGACPSERVELQAGWEGGREAHRLRGWRGVWAQVALPEAPGSEPGPGPSMTLLGGSMRLHCCPYLPREHQLWHLPPRGSDVWGDKGNMAENTADMCQTEGRGRPQSPWREQGSGPDSTRLIPCLEGPQRPEWCLLPSPALGAFVP